MPKPSGRFAADSILRFAGTAWALIFFLLLLDTNLSKPNFFDQSDYVMSFYVAGRLAASGRMGDLYPQASQLSFARSPFDQAAHRLIPGLPAHATAVFMYNPIVAWIFAPLSAMSPRLSMLGWQLISIACLAASVFLLARALNLDAPPIFFMGFLFLPVIATVWAGQVSLALGLLFLSVGAALLLRGRAFPAGLIWALVALKPQFLFLPGLFVFGALFARRFACATGFLCGLIGLGTMNFLVVPMHVIEAWLHSIRVGESFFSGGQYQIREYLITSLPANILLAMPDDVRAAIKWPVYAGAGALWLIGAWCCGKILGSNRPETHKFLLILVLSSILLPLTTPYLLYYDLCLLLPAGLILLGHPWPPSMSNRCKAIGGIGWFATSLYMLAFVMLPGEAVQPLVLQAVFLALWVFWTKAALGQAESIELSDIRH